MSCSTRGNALFLILIAVALFAALSYAITQSGRGDSGNPDRERALVTAGEIIQDVGAIRNAINRMILTGTAASSLTFCSGASGPTTVCTESTTGFCTSGTDCVFAPDGGGVPPLDLPTYAESAGGEYSIVGSSGGLASNFLGVGTTANDAYLYVVLPLEICEALNTGLDLSISPIETDANFFADGTIAGYSGAPYKCVTNGSVYYGAFALTEN